MRETGAAGTLNVALLNGVCVRHDAISYSLRLKLDLLRSLRSAGRQVEVRAFVQGTDYEDPDIHVRSLSELVRDPDFSRSDILVYEFGIDYELFDSIFLLRGDQRSIGIYHNLTPLELVDRPSDRAAVERGLLIRRNLGELDLVASDSEFNRQDLVDCGLDEGRLSVLELPPRTSPRPVRPAAWSGDPVEVLFVGRLVRAKGIFRSPARGLAPRRRRLQPLPPDPSGESAVLRWRTVIQSVRSAARDSRGVTIRLVSDPDDRELDELYRNSSVFVIPSHHEGYCLPVLEAFHSGCQVVASDAGNLPSIVASLGQIVPTGERAALATALREAIAASRTPADDLDTTIPTVAGLVSRSAWQRAVAGSTSRRTAWRATSRLFSSSLGLSASMSGRTAPSAWRDVLSPRLGRRQHVEPRGQPAPNAAGVAAPRLPAGRGRGRRRALGRSDRCGARPSSPRRPRLLDARPPGLSVSRNIGIRESSGELVAFIDDDAVPDPWWLDDIVPAFDDPEVAVAGGPVYDFDGRLFSTHAIADAHGDASIRTSGMNPTRLLAAPCSDLTMTPIGTNSVFRRAVLVEAGGFDEEFGNYFDETELCRRLTKRGWVVEARPSGFVQHLRDPSRSARSDRIIRDLYPILQESVLLLPSSMRAPETGCSRFCAGSEQAVDDFRSDILQVLRSRNGLLSTPSALESFERDVHRAGRRMPSRAPSWGLTPVRPHGSASSAEPFSPLSTDSAGRAASHLRRKSRVSAEVGERRRQVQPPTRGVARRQSPRCPCSHRGNDPRWRLAGRGRVGAPSRATVRDAAGRDRRN